MGNLRCIGIKFKTAMSAQRTQSNFDKSLGGPTPNGAGRNAVAAGNDPN